MAKKRTPAKKPAASPPKRRKPPVFRLLPMTMLMAFGLFCLKSVEVYREGAAIHQAFLVGNVLAEEDAEETTVASAEPADPDAAEKAAEEAVLEGADEKAEEAQAPEQPPVDITQKPDQYTAREVDVLQSLAKRREKLDMWEKEIALREQLLKATEERIDTKLQEMEDLSDKIQELLVAYNEEEDAKISSLVKIYESMKPKEAARIFDELDMGVLLMVVDRMSERRVAPILASMSPEKAKDVTQKLADQQKLNQPPTTSIEPEAPLF